MAVRVITDSTSYMPVEMRELLGVSMVSLGINDEGEPRREMDMDYEEFYARLKDIQVLPTSSQPSPEELREAFERIVAAGDEALGVFISSDMSGTYESARMVAELVRDAQPGAVIEVMDTRSNSMQEGFAVAAAARMAAQGANLAACQAAALETMARTRYLFAPRSLEYLRRGGRIGRASALLGTLLGIAPILTVENGVTDVFAKVRTFTRCLDTMAERLATEVGEKGFRRAVVHSIAAYEESVRFADRIAGLVGAEVPVVPIGPVIGLHVGPAVGLVYETEEALR